MRKRDVVPIGQGCKAVKSASHTLSQLGKHRCKEHPWFYLNICLGCGDKFHSDMPHTKTCSDKCRQRLSRSRRFDKTFQMVMHFASGEQ